MKTVRNTAVTTSAAASSDAKVATDQKTGTAALLFRQARHMGLQPSWVVPGGLFAVSVDGQEKYINFARSPLNSHISISLATDKHLTRLVLGRHGFQNIPFCRPRTRQEAAAFLREHGKVIAKPVGGSGARDIHIISRAGQLWSEGVSDYILEKYIVGQELRYLVLNGKVIAVHRSDYGVSVAVDRRLQRISYHQSAWDDAQVAMAIKIAQALDLRFVAVDFLIESSGRVYILEVNTAPGLKWFHAPTSGPAVDVAGLFLEALAYKERRDDPLPLGAQPPARYN